MRGDSGISKDCRAGHLGASTPRFVTLWLRQARCGAWLPRRAAGGGGQQVIGVNDVLGGQGTGAIDTVRNRAMAPTTTLLQVRTRQPHVAEHGDGANDALGAGS